MDKKHIFDQYILLLLVQTFVTSVPTAGKGIKGYTWDDDDDDGYNLYQGILGMMKMRMIKFVPEYSRGGWLGVGGEGTRGRWSNQLILRSHRGQSGQRRN